MAASSGWNDARSRHPAEAFVPPGGRLVRGRRAPPAIMRQRPEPCDDLFAPIFGTALGQDAQIEMLGRGKEPVGAVAAAGLDAVDPDDESLAAFEERVARFGGRADEIGDHRAAGFGYLIAEPADPPCLLDAIGWGKAQILVDVLADFIGVQMNGT